MKKHRAIELYHRDSPFKPKVVKSRKVYSRKSKHKNVTKYNENFQEK